MPEYPYRTDAGAKPLLWVLGLFLVAVVLAGLMWVGPCGR